MAQPYARRSLYENKRGFGETDLCTFPTGIVMNTLVIIESPNKAPTIKSCLGKGYKVVASKGHVRDLPKSKLGIDIENGFEPQYINIRGKGELINELKKEAKKSDFVLLATDPDREGEAISWHLSVALGLDPAKTKRITFNEITKTALKDAIKHPRDLDMRLVDSQQTRRILDRLVGYKISPFLWKKIKSGLSAGRVQSVATRMIVERDDEIRAFVPEEYWSVTANLITPKNEPFVAKFYGNADGKLDLTNSDETKKVLETVGDGDFIVSSVRKQIKQRRPLPPFTTSTLQQEANRRLGFPSQRTMMIAQELYEGVHVGEKGMHGLITYMRTDSVRISDDARALAKTFICTHYGDNYYPATPNIYKSKSGAQDAHEAIRPTDPSLVPENVRGKLSADQYKLYKLIWERFVASQMKNADFDTVASDLTCGGYVFRATGRTMRFPGFLAVYGDVDDGDNSEDGEGTLPELAEGDIAKNHGLKPEQHFTAPPAKFTEGSLVKMLEEKGIGRPSTYTPTITTIISRGYVQRNGKALEPTELGRITTQFMKDGFPKIVDYDFTARMEDDLDLIENGKADYHEILSEFYADFVEQLHNADKMIDKIEYKKPVEETDIICEKCGARMVIREGRYGKFAACPNFPRCRNTKRLDKDGKSAAEPEETDPSKEIISDEKCPNCGSDMVLRKGAYGTFFACRNYPDCKTTKPYHKDTGFKCPLCGKKLVTKTSKSRRTFYSCEDYPNCSFSCWDIPTDETCPKCGAMVLKKKYKNIRYCSKNCGWTSEGEKKSES